MEPNWEDAASDVESLFRTGRRIDAWHRLQPHYAKLFAAGDPRFLQLAHDLSWWLGHDSRRLWIGRRSWRQHQDQLWAWTRHTFDSVRKGRALEVHEHLSSARPPEPASDRDARWFELGRARVYATLRDYRRAHQVLDAACDRYGDGPDAQRERTWTHWFQDRTGDALDVCMQARERWPDDAALRETEAWCRLQLFRNEEALSALDETCSVVQCPSLELLYADALIERESFDQARARLENVIDTMPLDRTQTIGAHMMLARVHRATGRDRDALASMQRAGPRMRKWRDRLATFLDGTPSGGGRVVLPVPFVRQDHSTCSPATMAALLEHAGVTVEQREIAAQITYDGTPSHAEMRWAQGRELGIWFFQFDLEVAHRLIDAGLPFAISTRGEHMGHRQAVCGYDKGLGTVIVRDPNFSSKQELDAEWLQTHMRSRGGDCALILPATAADRVPTELLPHHREMMLLQELRAAYDRRELRAADDIAEKLLAAAPSNVRWEAATRVAREREDRKERLRLYRERYEAHADDPFWQYCYAIELRAQDRWHGMVELLERHASAKTPYLTLLLADHLRHATPTRPRAEALARRATRRMPGQAMPIRVLADIHWSDPDRREHALDLYRVATTLEPLDEALAQSYSDACTQLGHPDRAITFLQGRVDEFGRQRWEARTTLARALTAAHRRDDAIRTLQEAQQHADDPELRDQLFDLLLADSQREQARALLHDEDRWRPLSLQDARRRMALAEGDTETAQDALLRASEIDPGNGSIWFALLRNLVASSGLDAALAKAEQCVREHGDNPRLLVRIQEFYDEAEQRDASERLLRRLVDEHPAEYWLLGRFTRMLIRTGRADEAAPHVATMLEQMSDELATWLDAIDAAEQSGKPDRARELADEAAQRWANEPTLLNRRRQLARSKEQSAQAVRQAMASQLAAHTPPDREQLDYLIRTIEEDLHETEVETFLASMQERFSADPALAAARCSWLRDRDPTAAIKLAEGLQRDVPWDLENWILLSNCLHRAGERDRARRLLEQLIEREPAYAQAFVELGESFEHEGRTPEAIEAYARGIEQCPNSPVLHGMRASLGWNLGDREQALLDVDRAALLDPDYGWARRMQVLWRGAMGRHDDALAAAEACARDNPMWRLSYDLLAHAHEALGDQPARIDALRNGLRLSPRVGAARTDLLNALLELRMFEAAEQVIVEGLELLGDDPNLHLFRLRIQRMQGELVSAREQLVALLERHAEFDDGWIELLQWLDDEQRDADLLRICSNPPAAIADNPTPHAYAADVHIRLGDLADAERSLRSALELAPDHDWARDRLAFVLLQRGKPKQVLTLFPGANDPDQQPFGRAAMLCEALARTGERQRAERFFERLLREPDADLDTLREADRALRGGQERRQQQLSELLLEESERDRDAVRHEHLLAIAVTEGDPSFWRRLDRFANWLPSDQREAVLTRLLYACKGLCPVKDIDRWVCDNIEPPIEDTEAWARLVFALNDDDGAATAVRLTGGNYRRQGVRGWMLANLAGCHADLEQWRDVEQVSTYALSSEVPADHSVWWHRRFLAECAYRRGDHDRALELCDMATESFPGEKVMVVQIATLANIGKAGGWLARRRAFFAGLPEILRQARMADEALRGPHDKTNLDWWRLFRAAPTPTGLLLALGGRRLVERLQRV